MFLRVLVILVLIAVIQAAGLLFIVDKSWLVSEVVAGQYLNQSQTGGTDKASDKETTSEIEALDSGWARTEMIIVLAAFALFFIVGVYWWTYGKLHHKIPRY